MATLKLELPPHVSESEARTLLAMKLFEEHRLTTTEAANLAGVTRVEFISELGRHGVAVFDQDPGDLEREAAM